MRIVLVSADPALARTCRQILNELVGTDWTLVVADGEGTLPAHELCVWDFAVEEPNRIAAIDAANLQRCFFLLYKNQLPRLQQLTGRSDLHVLLKPVTPAMLGAMIVETGRSWINNNTNPAAQIGTLRAERDEMLQCLLQANLRLQEYDQERTNFLARSTHDFRAPLTALTGYCSLLLEEQVGSITAEQREILERMQRSARRLSRMANGMFQLSVVGRRDDQHVDLREGDINDCVVQALHEIAPFVEGKRITVSMEIAASSRPLLFEKTRMEQMLVNLLDNACKFTPRDGTINLKGYPFFWERRAGRLAEFDLTADRRCGNGFAPNSFRLDIYDSGPAIPAGQISRIFEEYTSYSGGQDRSGGGLGLAICKMIAHQHQGKIWAENTPEGPVFSFVLPYQQAQKRLPAESAGIEAFSCAV